MAQNVLALLPNEPGSGKIGLYYLALILERTLADLAGLGVSLIEIELGHTTAEPSKHEVVDITSYPSDREDLAGTVAKVVRQGFRRDSQIIRQPSVVAYRKGWRRS